MAVLRNKCDYIILRRSCRGSPLPQASGWKDTSASPLPTNTARQGQPCRSAVASQDIQGSGAKAGRMPSLSPHSDAMWTVVIPALKQLPWPKSLIPLLPSLLHPPPLARILPSLPDEEAHLSFQLQEAEVGGGRGW